LALAESIEKASKKAGVKFMYTTGVNKVVREGGQISLILDNGDTSSFDKVVCTLPTPLFSKISDINYPRAVGLGAVNLVLALKESFLKDGSYWLNINEKNMPFLAIVEHTNYMDNKNYDGDKLLYIGNYLPSDHTYFSMSESELLKLFMPFLKKINPDFDAKMVRKSWIWKAPFAQPVVTCNYSKVIPSVKTSIPGVYLANIQQVYPWDRGTNYAVELGIKVANYAIQEN
jgi:protoporphyrinogen oxidase